MKPYTGPPDSVVVAAARLFVFALIVSLVVLLGRLRTALMGARARWHSRAGRTHVAVACARMMLQRHLPTQMRWSFANTAIDVFVNAGLYAEALSVGGDWPRSSDHYSFTLAKINQAEALANLGQLGEALDLLDSVRGDAMRWPFSAAGWKCLRAWILALHGNVDAARSILNEVNPHVLAPYYVSEVWYTWAAIERAADNPRAALEHATKGLKLAIRASSIRNGLFMVADIQARLGDTDAACAKFREAADHAYKAQAADGLMRWAALLRRLGKDDEAVRVERLAAERDPESALVRKSEADSRAR